MWSHLAGKRARHEAYSKTIYLTAAEIDARVAKIETAANKPPQRTGQTAPTYRGHPATLVRRRGALDLSLRD